MPTDDEQASHYLTTINDVQRTLLAAVAASPTTERTPS